MMILQLYGVLSIPGYVEFYLIWLSDQVIGIIAVATFLINHNKKFCMPTTAKNSTESKSTTNGSKASAEGKSPNAKKQGTVNIKSTSARDKAKNFDEGRRNDANSNEL